MLIGKESSTRQQYTSAEVGRFLRLHQGVNCKDKHRVQRSKASQSAFFRLIQSHRPEETGSAAMWPSCILILVLVALLLGDDL
jgi:hypothetical protein